MPNLEDARFQWDLEADIFPIFAFSELKKLRRLILTSIPLNASFPSVCRPTFRNLVSLSLVAVEVEPANIVELLTPVSFPSLRHLRLSQRDDLDKRPFFPDLLRAFFYRLDTLEVYFDDLPVMPMWLTQQCRVPVVVNADDPPTFKKPHESRCSHLLLLSPDLDQPDESSSLEMVDGIIIRALQAFHDLIVRSPDTVFALYLPAEVDNSVPPFAKHHRTWIRLKLARDKLVHACKAHDVRVVYRPLEDRTSSPRMLPGVSASFVADRENALEDLRTRARLTGVGDDDEVYELGESLGEQDWEEEEEEVE